jgi:hypothetical protein
MNAIGEQVCGVRVPQIMEADAGQTGVAKHPHPFMRQAARLKGRPVNLRHDKCLAIWARAEAQCVPT